MKLDPKIVEAAKITQEDKENLEHAIDDAEARAHCVLKAASECVPDEVVEAAINAFWEASGYGHTRGCFDAEFENVRDAMRAALSAGLAKWAEEE
jgi:hypothetical protein